MLKLGLITTTRADYGILFPLIKKLNSDSYFQLEVIVTGSHLLTKHGNTIKHIESDGVTISHIIDIFTEGDSQSDICKNISNGIASLSNLFEVKKYDGVIILGDRYELWSICIPAVIHKIPIIHIGGGELTQGAVDDIVRHSVTKMASVHFPSIDLYKKRIIQMGENPQFVSAVGALGIDNIRTAKTISQQELYDFLGLDTFDDFVLVTYHPVTQETNSAGDEIKILLESLINLRYVSIITMPNADVGRSVIYETILRYAKKYPAKIKAYESMGQAKYLTAMKYAKMMIGNSSSGILESLEFKLPVVNIGSRQAGRYRTMNIIDCECTKEAISESIVKADSQEFRSTFENQINPYGTGTASDEIIKKLKLIDFSNIKLLIQKRFIDIS